MQAFDRLIPMVPGIKAGDISKPNQMPSWLVKILDYTESAVEGFKDYSILRGFYAKTSRSTSLSGRTDALSSNVLRHSHVVLCIPRGNLQTKLESHLYKSNPITKITIVNIAQMDRALGKLQEIEYEQCYVQQIEPALDWILVELKITKYSNTLFKYGTDGRLQGKDMASMDYTLNPKIDVSIYDANFNEDENNLLDQEDEEPDEDDGLDELDGQDNTEWADTVQEENDGMLDGDEAIDAASADDQNTVNSKLKEGDSGDGQGISSPEVKETPSITALKSLVGDDKEAIKNAVQYTLGLNDAKDQATSRVASSDQSSGAVDSSNSSNASDSASGDNNNSGNAASSNNQSDSAASINDSSSSGLSNSIKKKKSLLDDILKKTDEVSKSSGSSA